MTHDDVGVIEQFSRGIQTRLFGRESNFTDSGFLLAISTLCSSFGPSLVSFGRILLEIAVNVRDLVFFGFFPALTDGGDEP